MRIHCDTCGAEIEMGEALVVQQDDLVFYLCSRECAERKEYHEVMQDPGPEDDQAAPDMR